MKKILALILCLTIVMSVITVVPFSAQMIEDTPTTDTTSNASISGDELKVSGSSLAGMLGNEFDKQENELTEDIDNSNKIYEIVVHDQTAYVNFHTQNAAKLIVGVFDEEGQYMVGTAMQDVEPEMSVAELALDIEPMPQYYYLRSFLLDKDSNLPLCKQFECDTYTQVMQEYLSKTTEDFDEEKVLNLDSDDNNNFLVYNDDTVLVDTDEETNIISEKDDENQVYVIENIDDTIASLQPGDVFAYDYSSEETLIIKVSSITIDGTTATITGETIDLTEAFEFIRIEAENNTDCAEVDNSDLEDGVEFDGVEEEDALAPTGAELINFEGSKGMSLKYELKKEYGGQGEYNKLNLKGSVGCSFNVKIKAYYDAHLFAEDEVELSVALSYEYSIKVSLNLRDSVKIPLGHLDFMIAPGVFLGFTPSIVFEASASISVNGKLTGQVGKKFENGKFKDNNKKPTFSASLNLEGSLFIGFSMEPNIKIIGDVIKASMTIQAGITVNGKMSYSASSYHDTHPSEKHDCTACIDGDKSFDIELSFELAVLKKWKWSADVAKLSWNLGHFYYSNDIGFGEGKCPNLMYRQTVTVLDANGTPIPEADVNGIKTGLDGVAYVYLKYGSRNLTITKGNQTVTKSIFVETAADRSYTLNMTYNYTNGVGGSTAGAVGNNRVLVSGAVNPNDGASSNASYVLYENGLLSISGSGVIYGMFTLRYLDNYRDRIKQVNINNGIKGLDHGVFAECKNLTTINIPASVSMEMMSPCMDCPSLSSINVDPNNPVCTSVDGILYSKDMTRLICVPTAKSGTFSIPSTVTDINEDAFGDSGFTTVNIPRSVKNIGGYPQYTNYWYGNYFGRAIKHINVSPENSVFSSIDGVLFNKNKKVLLYFPCARSGNYTVPSGVTSIASYAFYISKINSVSLPSGITSIGLGSFRASAIAQVYIPKTVTEIKGIAFGDSSLKEVYYEGTSSQWSNLNVEYYWNNELKNATKHYNAKGLPSASTGLDKDDSDLSTVGSENETIENNEEDVGNNEPAVYVRENLVPDTDAVLMVLSGSNTDYEINNESLLYIAQTTVDKFGKAEFTVYGDYSEESTVMLAFGECSHPSGQWKTAKAPTATEHGLEHFFCDTCGAVTESRDLDPVILLGDADGDGEIATIDVTQIMRTCARINTGIDKDVMMNADVDGNGRLEITDVTYIQRYLARQQTPYAIGQKK